MINCIIMDSLSIYVYVSAYECSMSSDCFCLAFWTGRQPIRNHDMLYELLSIFRKILSLINASSYLLIKVEKQLSDFPPV